MKNRVFIFIVNGVDRRNQTPKWNFLILYEKSMMKGNSLKKKEKVKKELSCEVETGG